MTYVVTIHEDSGGKPVYLVKRGVGYTPMPYALYAYEEPFPLDFWVFYCV
jgi:hypothetical protein